ncbi:family 43 glycosylhydrolase [Clostridium fungisolvens]|uniref:Ricin B lectin domain-containing protein n=1 Tax=Clostridium fungisolvens TaxID=1604897 RepID=A0A6V8SJT6_9CLOT|nr:family 43 glycosylhydrolase [Clostridium fungisolvens]GFP77210.1 hypothetical protein bsdtw1_03324 [Clostridium fungisolvens]
MFKKIFLCLVIIFAICLPDLRVKASAATFTNPIGGGADPWVISAGGSYYYVQSNGVNTITIRKSSTLQDITSGTATTVWTAPAGTPYSSETWAPELHYVRGRWYIYFAADNGANENHRMYCLEGGTDANNPLNGAFNFKGKVAAATDRWAIDGTVLDYNNQLYFIWSGWEGTSNVAQNLYIAKMSNPYTISGDRVLISTPDQSWERNGTPYINEGPEVIVSGSTVNIIYSASGSWTDDYCLGRLTCTNGDLMNRSAYSKVGPVFSKFGDVYGPGHASFVKSPDGVQNWIVYHAAVSQGLGWTRNIRMQQFTMLSNGTPMFGVPVQPNVPLQVPSTGNSMPLVNNGIYTLTALCSNLNLDVSGGKNADGTKLQQYQSNGTAAQQFRFVDCGGGYYKIVPMCAPNMCVDNPYGSTALGGAVAYQICTDNGQDAQRFRIEDMGNGVYKIVNKASNLPLDVAGASTQSGAQIDQWQDNGNNAQRWRLTRVG